MTRDFLKEMGLEKEQINKILDENSSDIGKAKDGSDDLKTECDSLKAQLSERDKQLEDLKKSSGDNAELKKQIEALQQQNAEQQKAHEAELKQLKLDNAIDTALTAAGAKNIKAVKPFIDTSKVKLDNDGKLTGLDEQLKEVQKTEGYLFAEKQQKQQTFKGFQPGASGDVKPGTEVDTSKMTYSELAAYMAANPDAKIN